MNNFKSTDYDHFFELSRLDLTFRLSVFMSISLSILIIFFSLLDQPAIYPSIVGFSVSSGLVVLIKVTKRYLIPAAIFTFTGTILSISSLFLISDANHFIDTLWMIVISLFCYFTLGRIWGNTVLFIQFVAIVIYLLFFLSSNLQKTGTLTQKEIYTLAINASFAGIMLIYLIHQFLKRNTIVLTKYQQLTTELKVKNNLVEQQNKEKTAMLMEIHHRVKNNLQVITSLLRLQSRDIKNDESVHYFKEAIDRIGAMALIHNQMYQSRDLNKIDLDNYLKTLSNNILSSYTLEIPVNIEFDIQLKHSPSNAIVSIALIFNELVSNSLKHAFKGKKNGNISIAIKIMEKGLIQLTYIDDGNWEGPIREDSFGLELIDTLVEQLNGSLKLTKEKETRFELILEVDIE